MLPRDHSRSVLRISLWVICNMSLAEPKYLRSAPFLAAMSSAMHGNAFQTQFISSPSNLDGLLCSKTSTDIVGYVRKELRQDLKPQTPYLHWLDHRVQTINIIKTLCAVASGVKKMPILQQALKAIPVMDTLYLSWPVLWSQLHWRQFPWSLKKNRSEVTWWWNADLVHRHPNQKTACGLCLKEGKRRFASVPLAQGWNYASLRSSKSRSKGRKLGKKEKNGEIGIVYATVVLQGLLFLVLKLSSPHHAGACHFPPLPCLVNWSLLCPLTPVQKCWKRIKNFPPAVQGKGCSLGWAGPSCTQHLEVR